MEKELVTYANSLGSGHLKSWKATSIIATASALPEIFHNEVHFLAYLKGCLLPDGFTPVHRELIMGWLYERLA